MVFQPVICRFCGKDADLSLRTTHGRICRTCYPQYMELYTKPLEDKYKKQAPALKAKRRKKRWSKDEDASLLARTVPIAAWAKQHGRSYDSARTRLRVIRRTTKQHDRPRGTKES